MDKIIYQKKTEDEKINSYYSINYNLVNNLSNFNNYNDFPNTLSI